MKNDPNFQRLVEHCQQHLIPQMKASDLSVSICPMGPEGCDVKFALELGFAIMLDKPMIAAIRPGTKIPEKLARVVDRFVECDFADADTAQRISEAVSEMEPLMQEHRRKREQDPQSDRG